MDRVYIVFCDFRYSVEDHETDVVAVYDSLESANELCVLLESQKKTCCSYYVESFIVF